MIVKLKSFSNIPCANLGKINIKVTRNAFTGILASTEIRVDDEQPP